MKHLLNGVAIAALFAIAAPALAQTNAPMTPASPPAKSAPAMAPAKTTAATPKKPMRMRHMASRRMSQGGGDRMTEDLNRQELARITGGGAPPPMGGQPPYGGNAPTSGAAGPFAPSAGAAPPPPPPGR